MDRTILFNDSFQNWKSHQVPCAQLILTDIPYQLGDRMYGSNPMWYEGGDNSNGESKYAHRKAFDTDDKAGFRIPEFFHFCSKLLKPEPKGTKEAGSGTTLLAATNLKRAYGFEIKKEFVEQFYERLLPMSTPDLMESAIKEEKDERQMLLWG